MNTKTCLTALALAAVASSAQAAKLVVVAVNAISFDENTGDVTQPFVNGSSPPTATAPAGAKGFVIAIDNSADPVDPPTPTGPAGKPLAVQDLTFSGPIVQRRSPSIPRPPVQTKEIAIARHGQNDAGLGNPYLLQNDSWWWVDGAFPQLTGPDTAPVDGNPDWLIALTPVHTGILGGANPPAVGTMTITATYNSAGSAPPGVWRFAYVVATGDVYITGILAGGQEGYDFATGIPMDDKNVPSAAILRYATGQIVPVPEPFDAGPCVPRVDRIGSRLEASQINRRDGRALRKHGHVRSVTV